MMFNPAALAIFDFAPCALFVVPEYGYISHSTPSRLQASCIQPNSHSLLQIVVEPLHRLKESLLLGELLLLDAKVGDPDGVAVLDAAEEVDLVRHAGLGEDLFRLVPFCDGEDLVRFWCAKNCLSTCALFDEN